MGLLPDPLFRKKKKQKNKTKQNKTKAGKKK